MRNDFEFRFTHFRTDGESFDSLSRYYQGASDWKPGERGGLTECQIIAGGEIIAYGAAHCSMKDNFSYEIGRRISKGRALKQFRTEAGI